MHIEIIRWDTNKIIHSGDFSSTKACLEDGVLKNISFNYAQLDGVQLNHAKLNHAKLNHAKLNYAKLNYVKLNCAELDGAELNYAKLNYAELNYVKLDGAKLNYVKLNGAQFDGAQLDGADSVCIQSGEEYWLYISHCVVVAGCQSHTPAEWSKISREELIIMCGMKAVKYHPRLMKLINFFLGLEL